VEFVNARNRVGWATKVTISRVQALQRVPPARDRQRHHSKSGGAGRLWSEDQAPSRLSRRRSVGRPMRLKLVGVANRSKCGAIGGRLSAAMRRSRPPKPHFLGGRLGEDDQCRTKVSRPRRGNPRSSRDLQRDGRPGKNERLEKEAYHPRATSRSLFALSLKARPGMTNQSVP
jgi:hypothetical protein